MFWREPRPDLHLYTDASDEGLAVLDPDHKRYLQIRFDDEERHDITSAPDANGFTINVRELFFVALAAVVWGETWKPSGSGEVDHICAWSDNASAVAWVRTQRSDNRLGQELIRAIGLCEATSRFRISTHHLPGAINLAADAASRAWNSSSTGRSLSVQDVLAKLQAHALAESSHQKYAITWKQWCRWCASAGTSLWTEMSTPVSSLRSRYPVGIEQMDRMVIRPPPFCPNLATSAGIIGESVATLSVFMRDTDSLCKGCHGCRQCHEENAPCLPFFSVDSAPTAISSPNTTVFYGGLRSKGQPVSANDVAAAIKRAAGIRVRDTFSEERRCYRSVR
ncbi:hypothetical protein L916_14276 [Phytophthora nicotianae]|uniref:Uncharacterized protein n=1 Tax=Phytophthora nicotianae TaxID=4792 RepID=W2IG42_PHYNI|nr:hypothetical protein L916_14276 [Phytophthora nicotianae]